MDMEIYDNSKSFKLQFIAQINNQQLNNRFASFFPLDRYIKIYIPNYSSKFFSHRLGANTHYISWGHSSHNFSNLS